MLSAFCPLSPTSGENLHGGGVLGRSYYTVVSIFSMISIMDLEGESSEHSS